MSKLFVSFFFLSLFLSAQSIYFKETKYHHALDSSFSKQGQIFFEKDVIKIRYANQTLAYSGNSLTLTKGNKIHHVNLETKPSLKMFFILFEAIYFEKEEILQHYFEVIKKKDTLSVHLKPLKGIDKYISSVAYQKTKNKLDFLQINLSSLDRIRIEER